MSRQWSSLQRRRCLPRGCPRLRLDGIESTILRGIPKRADHGKTKRLALGLHGTFRIGLGGLARTIVYSRPDRGTHRNVLTQTAAGHQKHARAWRPSVKRLLIVGAETVVGANLATEASDRYQVVALTHEPRVSINGCEMLTVGRDGQTPQEWLEDLQPDAVVLCGPASRSAWDASTEPSLDENMATTAGEWAVAARSQECHFTFISSDAVFSGPWMFHDEESQAFCPSAGAQAIRQAEKRVTEQCPPALIIRTNAFGWSPTGSSTGWIDQILADLDRRSLQDYDFLRHGTPILATDLADILLRAIDENLGGLHHVAGAERVNPLQFATRLADHFELPWLAVRRAEESLDEPVVGFGASETSLQTKKIRKALCVAMPMLSEGLTRLRAQQQDGYCDQFGPDHPVAVRQSA